MHTGYRSSFKSYDTFSDKKMANGKKAEKPNKLLRESMSLIKPNKKERWITDSMLKKLYIISASKKKNVLTNGVIYKKFVISEKKTDKIYMERKLVIKINAFLYI